MEKMLNRVILHVGPPKTGTTYIQNALTLCNTELTRHGFFYPPTQPASSEGQHSLALDILADLGKPVAYLSQAYLSWDSAFAGARAAGAHTMLISSEDFALQTFDEEAFARLRRILGNLELVVVFALRDPVATVCSSWQQAVKWGCGFGDEILEIDEAVPVIAARSHVRVIPYLERIERCLSPVAVRLFTVPVNADLEALLDRFSTAALLPIGALKTSLLTLDLPNANASLPYEQTMTLLRLNQMLYATDPAASTYPHNGHPRRLAARELILRTLSQSRTPGSRRPSLSKELRAILQSIRTDLIEWLRTRDVVGSLSDLDFWRFDENLTASVNVQEEVVHVLVRTVSALADDARVQELQMYLAEVEHARDWWKHQAEAWEAIAKSAAVKP